MKTWIYSWVIYPIVYSMALIWGLFKPKVRDTLRLRAWKDFLSLRFNAGQPIEYWLHVASQGELEYAIPILRELEFRKKKIIVTYYSISAKKSVEQLPEKFKSVSLVVPLPHDGLGLMREFVALMSAQGVCHLLLLKYELWPGLLWECNRQKIKVFLVDALEPGWFHRRLLHKLDGIFSGYAEEVNSISHVNIQVVGDTRVERVLERVASNPVRVDVRWNALSSLLRRRPTLVCGSMWPGDDQILLGALRLLKQDLPNIIWVPHELDSEHERQMRTNLGELGFSVKSFETAIGPLSDEPLAIIVMKKGILAELYQFGVAAYVGGAFGSGVHSVWEPALCGIPVACGPKNSRSPESKELKSVGMLTQVFDAESLMRWILEIVKKQNDAAFRDVIGAVVKRHLGAANRIVTLCEEDKIRAKN